MAGRRSLYAADGASERKRRVTMRLLFLPLALLIAACTTLRPVQPDELRGPNPPDRVRVTEANDSTVILRSPQLVRDTLIGTVDGTRRAFPLLGTTEIDTWEAAPGQTAAAILFGGGLAAFTYVVIYAANHSSSPRNCCPPGVPCPSSFPPCT